LDKETILMQLSPNVRVALDHRAKEIILNKRIIFDYELLYLEKGELDVNIENNIHRMLPGDIVLFRPGKEHGFVSVGGKEAWMPHIHFDTMYYRDFRDVKINFKTFDRCSQLEKDWIRPDSLGKNGLDMPDIIRISNHWDVLKSLKNIIYIFERRVPGSKLIQKSLVIKMLHDIMLGLEMCKCAYTSRHLGDLDRAVSYIMDHYYEKIRVEDLAKICCLSIHHFERLFKKRYQVSPSKYIVRHRIEKAKKMMLYSRMSLSEISERVGYCGIHSFSKAFWKTEGVSPSDYIKQIGQ